MEIAIYIDCHTIIKNFVNNGNPRFESFCMQWKMMMFQHLYSAQSSTIEVLQTTEAALHVAKRVICPKGEEEDDEVANDHLLRRIGALYLLYAIYFKQPTEQYIKIDMTLKTWRQMRAFIKLLEDTPATDEARYVFWRLYEANAFRFCGHDYCLGLEQLVEYDEIDENYKTPGNVTMGSKLLQELYEVQATQSQLPALRQLEDGYNAMKQTLSKEQCLAQATLPMTNIFKDIAAVFDDVQDILNEHAEEKKDKHKVQKKIKSTGQKRNELKYKGYEVTHLDNVVRIVSAEPWNALVRKRRACRMSARTVFADDLPPEMLEDLQTEQESEGENEEGETEADDVEMAEELQNGQKVEAHDSDQAEFMENLLNS